MDIQFEIKPVWPKVEVAREKSENFLRKAGINNQDHVNSIVMVLGELVENAIKYGEFENKNQKINISLEKDNNMIISEVVSPVSPKRSVDFQKLDETIQWIRGYQNPFEAYLERLKEISLKDLTNGESGLGLVRIAYEGQSILDFYIDDQSKLAISAIYEL